KKSRDESRLGRPGGPRHQCRRSVAYRRLVFDKLEVQSPAFKSIGIGVCLAAPRSKIVAIYPGSFDPITNGHLDLIERGSRLADRLIVAILENRRKQPLFSIQERVEMLTEVVKPYPNVEVGWFHG